MGDGRGEKEEHAKKDESEKDSKGEKDDHSKKDESDEGSKGEKEDHGKKEFERLFAADDDIEVATFTETNSIRSLSAFAAGGAGVLLVASGAVVFRHRRPV